MDSNLNSTFISDIRPLLIKQLNGIKKAELKKCLQKINPNIPSATSSKNQLINDITKQLLVKIEKFKSQNGGVSEALGFLKNWFLTELGLVIKNPSYQSLESIISREFQGINDSFSRSSKNLKNNQTLVNNIWTDGKFQQYPCICPKGPASLCGSKQQQNCYKCGVSFHPICLWGRSKDNKLSDTLPQCPSCFLINCLPQKKVEKVLFAGYLPTAKSNKIEFVIEFPMSLEIKNDKKMIIEARCMRIDSLSDHNRYELTWPDNSTVFLNSKKITQYKPLAASSALKRRTDQELVLDKSYIYCDIPERLVIQEKHQREGSSSKYEWANHFVMIFAVSLQKKEDLLAMFSQSRLSVQQSKEILKNYLSCKSSNDIQVQKLSVSLMCPFYSNKISIPVRSRHCSTHFQPFDLNNFIEVNKTTGKGIVLKYKCPLCKKRAYDLVVDEYLQDLINSKGNGQNFSQITFRADGQTHFQEEDVSQVQSEEENNDNKQEAKEDVGNESVELIPLQMNPQNEPNLNEQQQQGIEQREQKQQNQIVLIDLQEDQQQQSKANKQMSLTVDKQIRQTKSSSLITAQNPITTPILTTTANNTLTKQQQQFPLKRRAATQKQQQQRQQQVQNKRSSQQVMTEIIRKHVKKSETQREIKKLLANKLVTTEINSKPKLNGQLSQEQLQSQNVINQLRQPEMRVFGNIRDKEKQRDSQANNNNNNSRDYSANQLNNSSMRPDDNKKAIQKRDTQNNESTFIKTNMITPLTQPLRPQQFAQRPPQPVQQKQITDKYPLEPIEISSDEQSNQNQNQQTNTLFNNNSYLSNSNEQKVQKSSATLMTMKHRLYEVNKVISKNIKKSSCNNNDGKQKQRQRQKDRPIRQSTQKRNKIINGEWQQINVPSSSKPAINSLFTAPSLSSSSTINNKKLGLQSLLINTMVENSSRRDNNSIIEEKHKLNQNQQNNEEDIIFEQTYPDKGTEQKGNNNNYQLQEQQQEAVEGNNENENDNESQSQSQQQQSSYSYVVEDIQKQPLITKCNNDNKNVNETIKTNNNNNNNPNNINKKQQPQQPQLPQQQRQKLPELKKVKGRNYLREINTYLKAGEDYVHPSARKRVKQDNNNNNVNNGNNISKEKQSIDDVINNNNNSSNNCLDDTIYEESEYSQRQSRSLMKTNNINNNRSNTNSKQPKRQINKSTNQQQNTLISLSTTTTNNTNNKSNTFDNPIELVDSEQEDQYKREEKEYLGGEGKDDKMMIELENNNNNNKQINNNNGHQKQNNGHSKNRQKDNTNNHINNNLNNNNNNNNTSITTLNINPTPPQPKIRTYQQQLKQLREQMQKNRQKTQKYSKLYNIRSITEEDEKVFFQLLEEVNSVNNYQVF